MNAAPNKGRPLLALSANSSWNLLNFCRGLIAGLQANGFSLAAVVPADGGAVELEELGVAVHPIPLSQHGRSPIADLKLLARYSAIFRQIRPSAFLGITAKPNIYGSLAAQMSGIPTINSVTGLGTGFLGSRALEMLISAMYRAAFFRSSKVFFLNRDDYELFVSRGIVTRNIASIIPGSGIDLDHFRPAAATGNDSTTFLFIGRLLTDKGVREYLDAAKLVKTQHPEVRLQMLGPIEPHPKAVPNAILREHEASGHVELLGSTDDVRPYIARADCVVLPSYREGLPRVLVEAAAMARPVIASDVPGCRDVVEDGVTGYLCEVKSAESLASAMSRFVRNSSEERAAMAQAARWKAEREFGDEHVLDAYLNALAEVLGKAAEKTASPSPAGLDSQKR